MHSSIACIYLFYTQVVYLLYVYVSLQAVHIPGLSVVVLSWKWVELCLNDM